MKEIKFTVRHEEKTWLRSVFKNRQLAVLEAFAFFIYAMTLLGKIVGGSEFTPYDSNCGDSLCASVRVGMLFCTESTCVCVSGHQTELQGLQQGTAAGKISTENQRACVKKKVLPSPLLPLEQDRSLLCIRY